VFGRVRQRKPATARVLPAGVVLGASVRVLKDVKGQVVRGGWTPALARQALAALRVAAASALDRRIAQEPAPERATARDGQIMVRHGWIRRRRTRISASTTSAVIARFTEAAGPSARGRESLEQLAAALATFSAVAYGRDGELDRGRLDAALDAGMAAIRRHRVSRMLRPTMALRKEQWASS
jgi:hypothetical protein